MKIINFIFIFIDFLRFLELQKQWQQQLTHSFSENGRLQKELQESLKAISVWEAKFTHARKLLDAEKKKRIRAEQDRDSLVCIFYLH